jgi:putative FmdB family regulatory protein
MPIYEYRCTSCGHRTDIVHGINDPGPAFCPACGAEATMRKQFALPAIHYKGSGWAKKDRGGSGSGTKAPGASSKKEPTPDATASTPSSDAGSAKSEQPARDSAAGASSGSDE